MVVFDASNSYRSPHAVSNVSQYESELPASVMMPQSVTTSSDSGLTNPGLSSLNFGLPQDGNSGLLSGGLSLNSTDVTSSLVVTSVQPSTASYATSFPISTSGYSNVGMNLPSFDGNFLQSNFSGLGINFTSSTAMPFPNNVTSYSSAVSTASTPSFGFLGSNPNFVTSSTAPTFSNNFPAGVNLFQAPSSSSTGPLLLGKMTSSVSTTSSASYDLLSNFSLNASTSATTENTVSYSTGTSLFMTPTSGLSFQVNPSALQSTPLSFSISNSAVSTSTVDSELFHHFPSLLKATITTSSTPFTTSTWSLGMSSQLSSDDRTSVGKQDEVEALNESQPADDGFTPLVKLTDSYEVKSGEEDEKELFSNRGKLYRYDQPTKVWKERGIGIIKILQHNVTGKVRVLMRREHILKICCNHYITSEMELTPLVGNNTSWAWTTLSDFSDEEAKVEKLCIRFKLFEVAQNFKTVFTNCVQKGKNSKQSTLQEDDNSGDLSVKFSPKAGSWECNDCTVFNEEHVTQCVACGSINPNSTVTSTVNHSSLGSSFASGAVSFGSFEVGGTTLSMTNQPVSVPPAVTIQSSTVTTEDNVESEHSSYEDEEEEEEEEEEENEGSDVDVDSEVVDSSETAASNLAARFTRKPGDWECNVCSVSNEKDIAQCIACGNTNPNITIPASSTSNTTTVSTSFGSGFKLSVSLPTAQPSQPTSTGIGFNLGGINSSLGSSFASGAVSFGSFEVGGTTLSMTNQPVSVPPAVTIQSSTVTTEDSVESEHSSYEDEEEEEEEEEEEGEEDEGSDVDVDSEVVVSSETAASNLAARFTRKPGDWECNVCSVSNEKDIAQFIACGNTNPNITIPASSTSNTTTVSTSFGSGFKLSVSLPTAQPSQPTSTGIGFNLGGIKLTSLLAGTSNANTVPSSSDSVFKVPGSFPATQISEPTSAGGFKLGGQSSGGFNLGGLNIGPLPNKPLPAATVQSSNDCIVTGELKPTEEEIEMTKRYMLPPTFYNYKAKPPCPGCRGCEDDSDAPTTINADTVPSVVTSTLISTAPVLFGASGGGLQSFASLANATEFQFGCRGDKKGFTGAGTMLFQAQMSQKEDEDSINPETEVDVDFKPLVSLPDTYQVTTGQESEEQLFCDRAKLYRYDTTSKQWKERGIGNMTIMKNSESGKSRLVMRREQVLKLCCNHVILPTMQLNPMLGGGNAWRWFTPCDFSEDEPKAEQLAIRFKKQEQADNFHEVISRCIQESTTVSQDTSNEDASSSAPTEEQQFSADIKFYQFQMKNKVWERQGNGKVIIIKTASGLQKMRVVDTSNCVFYEQSLSSTCKLTRFPSEENSWSWCYTRSNTSDVTRYAIRFVELSDSNQFEQLVCDHIVTIVPPHSPRSPEIPPLSPASSSGGSPCRGRGRGRPLIEAVKLVGVWCCSSCNTKNPASDPQCMVCGASKSTPSLLSPTGMQNDNPFYSKGKPVDYSVSSLTSGILSLSNSTAGSDAPRSYTPFSIPLLQHQQGDNESDGPPSLVSVPSQDGSSVASTEQRQPITRSLFQMPTFTISETKPSFPLLDATESDNFSLHSSTQSDNKEEEEHPETEANIFFDPVVSLPSDFDNKSGEENEECVFTHRAKLYRYDKEVKMWKDRGIGNIKILRHKASNKGRILMRREQVLKLCCNHYIIPGMTLKPGSFPGRSWVWLTSADCSEEVAQPETLGVKFKDPEIASDFKNTFYTFATDTQSLTVKPTDLSSEPSEDDDVVYVGEELPDQELIYRAQHFMLPRTFYNYLKRPPCRGCIGCMDEETECEVVAKSPRASLPTVTLPEVTQNVLLFSSDSEVVSFADLASAATSNSTCGFGGFGSGDNKGFAGAGKPLFSTPTDKENETVDSFEPTVEFKPIVKLSSDVTVQSGEENEMVLFSHRSKLYRFDGSLKQWKERGIGNIKILKHKKTGKCRILMRREQILKLCCNHLIVEGMTMTARDEKELQWMTLSDFSDEDAKAEQFTVKFKFAETANTFQRIFNNCLSNVDSAEETTVESAPQATSLSKNITSSIDSITTSTVSTIKEQPGVTSCSAAMPGALTFPPVTTGSITLATPTIVNSNIITSSTTTSTVSTIKEQPGVTSCSAAMPAPPTFASVTTSSTAPATNLPVFVFGSSGSKPTCICVWEFW